MPQRAWMACWGFPGGPVDDHVWLTMTIGEVVGDPEAETRRRISAAESGTLTTINQVGLADETTREELHHILDRMIDKAARNLAKKAVRR